LHLIVSPLGADRESPHAHRAIFILPRARRPRCNKIIPPSPLARDSEVRFQDGVSPGTGFILDEARFAEAGRTNPSVALINPLAHDRKWKAERREMDSPLANGYFVDRLIHNIHINGASIFFICIYIHIGRGIYYHSFNLSFT